MPGGPVKGCAAGGQDKFYATKLIGRPLASAGAVPGSLLAAQPLDEVLNRRFFNAVNGSDVAGAAVIKKTIQRCAIAILGAEGELLYESDLVQVALNHHVWCCAVVGNGRRTAFIESSHH